MRSVGPASLGWGNGNKNCGKAKRVYTQALKDLDLGDLVTSVWAPTVLDEVKIKLNTIRQLIFLFQDISWSKMRKMSLSRVEAEAGTGHLLFYQGLTTEPAWGYPGTHLSESQQRGSSQISQGLGHQAAGVAWGHRPPTCQGLGIQCPHVSSQLGQGWLGERTSSPHYCVICRLEGCRNHSQTSKEASRRLQLGMRASGCWGGGKGGLREAFPSAPSFSCLADTVQGPDIFSRKENT